MKDTSMLSSLALSIVILMMTFRLAGAIQETCEEEQADAESQAATADRGTSEQAGADEEAEPEELTYQETVVVTASRREEPLGDAVSLVTALPAEQLDKQPALVLDDHLRRVPGFSLFRRSNSIAAHPTSQGVSLRGIGPSGSSRSLVLFDGIPLNDPFGGWIYWNRIPSPALETVEVSRGATSQLYGSSALGGTLQIRPRAPTPGTFQVDGQVGNRQTYDFGVLAADRRGDLGFLLAGRVFDTGGYYIVPEDERGPVDEKAKVQFQNFLGRLEYQRFHVGLNLFHEERNNGTKLQKNDSWLALIDAGLDGDSWQFRFHTQFQEFNNTFSRVLLDRSDEFITAEQHFPAKAFGSSFTWDPGAGFLLGADWRQVRWDREELPSEVQNLAGLFAQYDTTVHPRVDLLLGARLDFWQNEETQASFNPRAGVLWRASDTATVRSSVYRGFRAPTLNELYRPFRIGNVFTEANPNLAEEHLWGVEGGIDLHPSRVMLVRLNAFYNSLQDPVSNVTLCMGSSGDPSSPCFDLGGGIQILRQRQNLDSATIKGGEAEINYLVADEWRLIGSYLYSDAVNDDTGLQLPQVSKHQGTAAVEYSGRFNLRVDARMVGDAFENDLNDPEQVLESFGVVDVMFRQPVSDRFDVFLGVENLFNEEYAVGFFVGTDGFIDRLGQPRMIHGGIRFRLNP
jgi:outer membrane receptor protein involved in Fe transport